MLKYQTLPVSIYRKKRGGFILIMLLVVIAIGMLIYYADLMWIGGGNAPKTEKPEEQPWAKEFLIKQDANSYQTAKPRSNKAVITKAVTLSGDVIMNNAKRGRITVYLYPDGMLKGGWQCQYSYSHSSYDINASFAGNSDATQDLQDDPSKLCLIAKGDYLQKATNLESGEITQTRGIIYINGWLGTDLSASGELSITTDKRWHVDYEWKASPQ